MADYTTVETMTAALDIDTTDFGTAQAAATAASRLVDSFCGRNFDQTITSRKFEPSDWNYCPVDDVATITSVTLDTAYDDTFGTTLTTANYVTDPVNGVGPDGNDGWPVTGLRTTSTVLFPMWGLYRKRTVKVTGTFGWSAVPDAVAQATLFLALEVFKATREAPFGTANLADFGPIRIRGNPRIADLLAPYQSPTAAGSPFLVA